MSAVLRRRSCAPPASDDRVPPASVVRLRVNGVEHELGGDPRRRLSDALRDELGLVGTKIGCHAGDCGACTVLVDDAQACACLVAVGQCEDRAVVTVEGLAALSVSRSMRDDRATDRPPAHGHADRPTARDAADRPPASDAADRPPAREAADCPPARHAADRPSARDAAARLPARDAADRPPAHGAADGSPAHAAADRPPAHGAADRERAAETLSPLQRAFVAHGAAQCGICTPGMLMAAEALLRTNASPSAAEVEYALAGVLCRCTGYRKIVDAVIALAHGGTIDAPMPAAGQAVGARPARLDAPAKVRGVERFGADATPTGALAMRIVRSPHAHAAFALGDLDGWRRARRGIVAVLGAADVPNNAFAIFADLRDQPVLADGVVRFRGEAVLAIVGEPAAIEALDLGSPADALPIEWHPRRAHLAIDAALAAAERGEALHARYPDNVLCRGRVVAGDVDAAFAADDADAAHAPPSADDDADAARTPTRIDAAEAPMRAEGGTTPPRRAVHVVESGFTTRHVEHAYIEPEAGYAEVVADEGGAPARVRVFACTQTPYMDRDEVAHVLGVEPARVHIVPSAIGGGFGGKLDLSVQPLLAVAAVRLGRPVRLVYERPESMLSSTKRHPARLRARAACDGEGRLVAFDFEGDFNTGPYASWGPTVANRVPIHAGGPYRLPAYRATTRAVLTNDSVAGAFRGFGVPQAALLGELLVDELAARAGVDALEFRHCNALRAGDRTPTGQRLAASVGLRACLDALRPAWRDACAAAAAFNADADTDTDADTDVYADTDTDADTDVYADADADADAYAEGDADTDADADADAEGDADADTDADTDTDACACAAAAPKADAAHRSTSPLRRATSPPRRGTSPLRRGTSPLRRGAGVACMWYGIGNTVIANPSTMRGALRVGDDGRAHFMLYNGAQEIGQGTATIVPQIFADALGVSLACVEQVMGDTDRTADAGKSSASRQTFVSGNAAKAAGEALRRDLCARLGFSADEEARIRLHLRGSELVGELVEGLPLAGPPGDVARIGEPPGRRVADLRAWTVDEHGDVASAIGHFNPPTVPLDADGQGVPYATYGFAAQIAEVEVDLELGTVKVLRLHAAHDVGKAIHPTLVEGQVHGGIAQGLGMALMEEYVAGRTDNLHDYLIPTVGDVPEVEVHLIEDAEPLGPYGAKGVGEPALVATAPAILNAIHAATGVRMREVPVTPSRLRAAIVAATREGAETTSR